MPPRLIQSSVCGGLHHQQRHAASREKPSASKSIGESLPSGMIWSLDKGRDRWIVQPTLEFLAFHGEKYRRRMKISTDVSPRAMIKNHPTLSGLTTYGFAPRFELVPIGICRK